MGSRRRPCVGALLACAAIAASCCCCCFQGADAAATPSFGDNFEITGAEDHVKTSPDGQTWYLSLDNKTGVGFQTKQKYLFGWFSMKLKLVGNDSAGVVTAYYMCSDLDAAPERDELDFEFLGNRTGEPYIIQTNVYRSGVGGREMRHSLWFDPTAEFHSYSILWNPKQIVKSGDPPWPGGGGRPTQCSRRSNAPRSSGKRSAPPAAPRPAFAAGLPPGSPEPDEEEEEKPPLEAEEPPMEALEAKGAEEQAGEEEPDEEEFFAATDADLKAEQKAILESIQDEATVEANRASIRRRQAESDALFDELDAEIEAEEAGAEQPAEDAPSSDEE